MLEIDALSRNFGTRAAVDGVSLQIEKGSFVGLSAAPGPAIDAAAADQPAARTERRADPFRRRRDHRAARPGAAPVARAGRHGVSAVQPDRPAGRTDQCDDGPPLGGAALAQLRRLVARPDKAIALAALEQFDMADLAAQRAEASPAGSSRGSRSPARWYRNPS